MKTTFKYKTVLFSIICVLFLFHTVEISAQKKVKKVKVRLKLNAVKVMDEGIYFDVRPTARVDGQFIDIPNLNIDILNEVGDSSITLGSVKTNMHGKARLTFKNFEKLIPDAENVYNISAVFDGNKEFKSAHKNIAFKNAKIAVSIVNKDSVNYISATLINVITNEPIADTPLNVQVQRLFKPLKIGADFYNTDAQGSIMVPIPNGIPGVDGKLTFQVVLADNDDFGTVKALITAPLGTPIVDKSTFDERTMWSPRDKTPLFLLIYPNILIFAIWIIIVYLFANMYKITKF
jgi:archaellin